MIAVLECGAWYCSGFLNKHGFHKGGQYGKKLVETGQLRAFEISVFVFVFLRNMFADCQHIMDRNPISADIMFVQNSDR